MCVGAGAYSFRNRMSVAENSTLIYITGYKNSVLKVSVLCTDTGIYIYTHIYIVVFKPVG